MASILIREKRGRFSTQTYRGEGQVKAESEIGVMHLQAEECRRSPAASRSEERDLEQTPSEPAAGTSLLTPP